MRAAPTRHALLFELIRQDNLARAVRDRFEPADADVDWQTSFALKALASLRAA